MYSFWIGLATVLLLGSTRSSVFASTNDVDSEVKVSAEATIDWKNVPLIEGFDWLVQLSQSTDEEVQAFIRGVESGEIWALQMMDTMIKSHWKAPAREIEEIKINEQCNENNSPDTRSNIQDDSCPTVPRDDVPAIRNESSGLCSSQCDSPSNNETQVIQNVNDTMQSDPLLGEMDHESNSSSLPPVEYVEFTTLEIFSIFFYSTFGVFVLTCTICDILQRRSRNWDSASALNTLAKFSIYSNSRRIPSQTECQSNR